MTAKKTLAIKIGLVTVLVSAMAAALYFMIMFDQANRKEEIIYSEDSKVDNGSGIGLPGLNSPQTELKPPNQPNQAKPVRAQTLDNGLKIEEYSAGQGERSTKVGDSIAVHYIGYLEDGKVFESSLKGEKQPFNFKLGSAQVIQGWDLGLQGMKVGSVRRLYIPASLAYGARGAGAVIPPNANLIFDVQLMAIQ